MSRIIVGVDGSDEAITALEWVLDEGMLRGAEVEVIHAFYLFPDLSEAAALTEQPDMVAQADERLRPCRQLLPRCDAFTNVAPLFNPRGGAICQFRP
jgi:nucleotide-binding universal stress UspA family protein